MKREDLTDLTEYTHLYQNHEQFEVRYCYTWLNNTNNTLIPGFKYLNLFVLGKICIGKLKVIRKHIEIKDESNDTMLSRQEFEPIYN